MPLLMSLFANPHLFSIFLKVFINILQISLVRAANFVNDAIYEMSCNFSFL